MSRQYLSTEYAWMPRGKEVHFVCEELPLTAEVNERGSRYLHAVYDKKRHCITHLDGAVRIYTANELALRTTFHVRNSGKVGKRVKIFRTDRAIEPNLLANLIPAFFVWNYDVARYFGAPIPDDL